MFIVTIYASASVSALGFSAGDRAFYQTWRASAETSLRKFNIDRKLSNNLETQQKRYDGGGGPFGGERRGGTGGDSTAGLALPKV